MRVHPNTVLADLFAHHSAGNEKMEYISLKEVISMVTNPC